jgi:hypothetical protein
MVTREPVGCPTNHHRQFGRCRAFRVTSVPGLSREGEGVSNRYLTASLPEALVARLKEPIPPLTQREILDAAANIVPDLDPAQSTTLAVLSPQRPWVDGVAGLDFSSVYAYDASDDRPIAIIGTVPPHADLAPALYLTLAKTGVLVTCRALGSGVTGMSPSFFRVYGRDSTTTFQNNTSGITTFTFLVPAGAHTPVHFRIDTDVDRIPQWDFFDCTITQV